MKIRIINLIPQSIESFKVSGNKIRYARRTVGKILSFEKTTKGIDAIAEITDKKLISKLLKK
jgi:hypothetical protein